LGWGIEYKLIAGLDIPRGGRTGGHFNNAGRVGEIEPPGPHFGSNLRDALIAVEKNEIDRKSHEVRVDPAGRPENQPMAVWQGLFEHQTHEAGPRAIGFADRIAQNSAVPLIDDPVQFRHGRSPLQSRFAITSDDAR
jgi:hypothetical protein